MNLSVNIVGLFMDLAVDRSTHLMIILFFVLFMDELPSHVWLTSLS